jgi:hypothetical protein
MPEDGDPDDNSWPCKEMSPSQQVVHMGRLGVDGILLAPLSDVPTAKVDMSFFTSPWQSGQFTLVSWCITSLSKV